ncbi:unnamed protein product [Boreogadus saida]
MLCVDRQSRGVSNTCTVPLAPGEPLDRTSLKTSWHLWNRGHATSTHGLTPGYCKGSIKEAVCSQVIPMSHKLPMEVRHSNKNVKQQYLAFVKRVVPVFQG